MSTTNIGRTVNFKPAIDDRLAPQGVLRATVLDERQIEGKTFVDIDVAGEIRANVFFFDDIGLQSDFEPSDGAVATYLVLGDGDAAADLAGTERPYDGPLPASLVGLVGQVGTPIDVATVEAAQP